MSIFILCNFIHVLHLLEANPVPLISSFTLFMKLLHIKFNLNIYVALFYINYTYQGSLFIVKQHKAVK